MTRAGVVRQVLRHYLDRNGTTKQALELAYDLGRARGLREGRYSISVEVEDCAKKLEDRAKKKLEVRGE